MSEVYPDEITFDLPVIPEDGQDPDELPCYRQFDPTDREFWCAYDHTGCLYNDGHNTCSHEGSSSYPLYNPQECWRLLGDTPINDNEEIEEVFLHFEVGTHREIIWHWFESAFGVTVATQLMYPKGDK